MATTTEYVIKRLEAMESELAALRRLLQGSKEKPPVTTFEGIWEGADISDEDIEEAKRSLFKAAYDDDL